MNLTETLGYIALLCCCACGGLVYVEKYAEKEEEVPPKKPEETKEPDEEDPPAPEIPVDTNTRDKPAPEDPTRLKATFTFTGPTLGIAFCPDGPGRRGFCSDASSRPRRASGGSRPLWATSAEAPLFR